MTAALPELLANSPTPGTDAALTTLAVAVNTTPASGTIETWTLNGAAPAALQASPGQFRFVIGGEICLADASTTGGTAWSVTRGVEGSTITTHAAGDSLYHKPTAAGLFNFITGIPKPIGFLDIIGHSHAADGGASMPDFGSSHKIDGFLQPALFRSIAKGGAIFSQHDQGNGALGDGGWAAVAREYGRQEVVSGFPSTTLSVAAAAGATSVTVTGTPPGSASNAYIVIGKGSTLEVVRCTGVSGSVLTVSGGTGAPGSTQGLANAHVVGDPVYMSVINFGYLPKSQMVLLGAGANDLPQLGPFAQGTVGTTAGSSHGLTPLQHAYRFAIAVMRCTVIYQDTHPSCIYSTNWTSTALTSPSSWPPNYAFGPSNAQNYHSTTVAGSTVTFSTEPNFPGGTVDIFFLAQSIGAGALWNVSVAGATTRTVTGAIDTRNVNAAQEYSTGSAPNGYHTGCVYRLTNLNPGINTVTVTAGTINNTAYFLGWGIESPQPPLVFCQLDPRPWSYQTWATWPYQTRAPYDNNGFSTQTATVAANAGTAAGSVTLGTAVTVGTTTTNSQAVYPGDTITIGTGSTQETRRVVAVDSTTTLHVDSNFLNAHSGAPCVIGLQDADYTGGGSSLSNPNDTQGAISVPGLWAATNSVINEFDKWVQSINTDDVLLKQQQYFDGDLVHYSDSGHALVAAQVIKRVLSLQWSLDQLSLATVPNSEHRNWVYGDNAVTPTPTGTLFQNGWSNYYINDTSYPRTGFYKDMRTRMVTVQCYVVAGGSTAVQSIIFQLPPGYRPANKHAFVGETSAGSGVAVFEIDPSGNITCIVNGSSTFMGFTGSFLAEQ